MRFLKGKSPRKELKFENFRAAGAPIFGVFGHNPKFVKKGGHPTPPYIQSRFGRIWPEGGGRILLIVLMARKHNGMIHFYGLLIFTTRRSC